MSDLSTPQVSTLHCETEWVKASKEYFVRFFHVGTKFSSDDLHRFFDEPPNTSFWGALTAALEAEGRIKEAGRIALKRPKANGRKITLWEVVR